MHVRGYVKGTTVAAEVAVIRAAFARAAAAVMASPDAGQAFAEASNLGALGKQLESEASDLRAHLAAYLTDQHGLTVTQLGALLGMSRSRAAQLVNQGRSKEQPVKDPGTDPEPAPVAAAVITHGGKILVARRVDRIPPWTFPATEMEAGESPAAAAVRAVLKETGLTAVVDHVIGKRIHPKTGRTLLYLDTTVESTDAVNGDPDDLAEVQWVDLATADQLLPDMYSVVRHHLGRLLGA